MSADGGIARSVITERSIRQAAKKAVKEAGSQRKYGEKIGLSASALSLAFRGMLPWPNALLDALGIEREVTVGYRWKDDRKMTDEADA